MSTAILVRVPLDLKIWLEAEAEEHDRSLSKEAARILREERQRREALTSPACAGESVPAEED